MKAMHFKLIFAGAVLIAVIPKKINVAPIKKFPLTCEILLTVGASCPHGICNWTD